MWQAQNWLNSWRSEERNCSINSFTSSWQSGRKKNQIYFYSISSFFIGAWLNQSAVCSNFALVSICIFFQFILFYLYLSPDFYPLFTHIWNHTNYNQHIEMNQSHYSNDFEKILNNINKKKRSEFFFNACFPSSWKENRLDFYSPCAEKLANLWILVKPIFIFQ